VKRPLRIMIVAVALLVAAGLGMMVPRFLNMRSEYGTSRAIADLKEHLRSNEGRWPVSAEELGGKYPVNGSVQVDYSMTSARLIESPRLLREAVRPRSGRFDTFPHYDAMIGELHEVLRETNPRSGGEWGSD
jgi:hypothetical protein